MDAIIRPSSNIRSCHNKISKLQLLLMLAEAEEDVENGRTAPIQGTFDDIRKSLYKGECCREI